MSAQWAITFAKTTLRICLHAHVPVTSVSIWYSSSIFACFSIILLIYLSWPGPCLLILYLASFQLSAVAILAVSEGRNFLAIRSKTHQSLQGALMNMEQFLRPRTSVLIRAYIHLPTQRVHHFHDKKNLRLSLITSHFSLFKNCYPSVNKLLRVIVNVILRGHKLLKN